MEKDRERGRIGARESKEEEKDQETTMVDPFSFSSDTPFRSCQHWGPVSSPPAVTRFLTFRDRDRRKRTTRQVRKRQNPTVRETNEKISCANLLLRAAWPRRFFFCPRVYPLRAGH